MQLVADKMNLLITLIGLASIVAPGLAQRNFRQVIMSSPLTTTSATIPSTTHGISKIRTECKAPNLLTGTCTPLAECSTLFNRLKSNPSDDTFVRYLKLSNKICLNEYAVVCCPSETQNFRHEPIFSRNTDEIPTKLPTMADGCGYVDRVFLKTSVSTSYKVGAWPWIALLGYNNDGVYNSSFKCGGALITSRHVLTAAHCIRQELTFVRLGEHDLNSETEATHVDIPVVKKLKHPQYNKANRHNDIALLYLDRNVQFSEKITPICIPSDSKLRSKDITGYHPYVAGWGKTMEGETSANILQELLIPIYDNAVCKELYRNQNRLISEEQFDNAVLCAGDLAGGKDTCQGDSGGPLMLPEVYEKTSARFHLIGIGSYGNGCAKPMIPGIYTRVSNFIEWIENGVADVASSKIA